MQKMFMFSDPTKTITLRFTQLLCLPATPTTSHLCL